MTLKRKEDEDCRACFAKDCDCECNTCRAARERNFRLSSEDLNRFNFQSALESHTDEPK